MPDAPRVMAMTLPLKKDMFGGLSVWGWSGWVCGWGGGAAGGVAAAIAVEAANFAVPTLEARDNCLIFIAIAPRTMRVVTTLVLVYLIVSAFCLPAPFQSNGKPYVSVPDLYKGLRLDKVPTTLEDGLVLSASNDTRYGYHFARPVDSIIRVMNGPLKVIIVPIFGKLINCTVSFQHWGILVSDESPPTGRKEPGTASPAPTNGTVFEPRYSGSTGLLYLDVKKWPTYWWRPQTVRYLGTLNRTDIELVNIGLAYIQHMEQGEFHNIYRNCQIFTSWYAKALWPHPALPMRVDQMRGKFWWWFRDWGRTLTHVQKKFGNFLGANNDVDELDSSIQFVPIEELLGNETTGDERDYTWFNSNG
jgi:hypothetical protein